MDQFQSMLDQLTAACRLPQAQRLQRSSIVAGIRAQALQAIATRPGEANVWAIVAEAALEVEATGGYHLPIPPKNADVDCPKCKGSGIFVWATGSGECFDCRGFGKVTSGQARYRLANVPPVLQREAAGFTPFPVASELPATGAAELPLSALVNTDGPAIEPIPF